MGVIVIFGFGLNRCPGKIVCRIGQVILKLNTYAAIFVILMRAWMGIWKSLISLKSWPLNRLRPCHTLLDSANGRVTDNKILCPFVSVRMRFLSVPHAVNAFRVR